MSTTTTSDPRPVLPLLCDHDGCTRPAVGRYRVGAGVGLFADVVRCKEHAGNADPKEPVNKEGK